MSISENHTHSIENSKRFRDLQTLGVFQHACIPAFCCEAVQEEHMDHKKAFQ